MSNKLKKTDSKKTFTIVDKTGKAVDCEIIYAFDIEDSGKKIVIYTDHSKTPDGEMQVYASEVFYQEDGSPMLKDIEADEEWAAVEKALIDIEKAMDEVKEENKNK